MERSFIQQRFVNRGIDAALIRARLDQDSPIRQVLDDNAVIDGPPGEGFLCWRDARGALVSMDEAIKQLRADPTFSTFFPDPPKIARGDGDGIRDNFERIASGEVQVVK